MAPRSEIGSASQCGNANTNIDCNDIGFPYPNGIRRLGASVKASLELSM
jgi:hypothetical protein